MAVQSKEHDRVWDITEKIGVCILTTIASDGMRSRPMHATTDRDAGCLWFITDQRGAKEDEIEAAPEVCLAFAETSSNTYLSITGKSEMRRDAAKAEALWNTEAQAWWPKGPTDPDVRVLKVMPEKAEYWDSRGNSITVALKLAIARATGDRPDFEEGAKVRIR
jgi:general stress protein 26